MKLFRSCAAVLALTAASFAHAQEVQQNASGDPLYSVEAPKAFPMLGDLLIARPLLIGATVIGAAAFVVSLPFTALGGNVGEAGKALVVDPGREAFVRCLGCSSSDRYSR
ncbi:multidrug transporter [Phytopseudomonas dryadis]|uniref:Multidrug transporter n=1 Tax=Phytopseudomonas dryadis TaxID=2487520 RepID=A0A4Q9R6F8_9GAMM|nr:MULTISPECIES: multidrug transporter [Pseudomonas]TBU96159.1 multidrug transporter [Pseudomonas dryadis]TBV02822.1 multidrug transporter [Pseudomonas dryadis]TBV15932.1 multidrug transporter [Pseudomonas sp. FRB 230]